MLSRTSATSRELKHEDFSGDAAVVERLRLGRGLLRMTSPGLPTSRCRRRRETSRFGGVSKLAEMTAEPPKSVPKSIKSVMQWKQEHDVIFLREVLASDLYSTRKGSTERGKIWSEIAERLNEASSCKFTVGQKSLRDRLKLLMQKYKQKMRTEEKASGIDTEMSEIDIMLEEICEKEEVAEQAGESEKKKAKAEKETAEKMRLKAMETLSESQKRNKENSEEASRPKKSRKSVGDAVSYLQEKSNQEMALRREEMEMKKQEEGRLSVLSQQQLKMQQEMLQMINQQHQDQQRQQQQQLQAMQSILTQQQQQSQAMLSLFERFATKKDP